MEEQIVSLYSKLKSNLYKNITVSYYSHPDKYQTEKFRLIDIYRFSYITVCNSRVCTELCFFSESSLIESITIEGESAPIYFNPFAKNHLNAEQTKKAQIIKKIENDFLSSTNIDKLITPKESFLITYYNTKEFDFNDLFFSDKQKEEFNSLVSLLTEELVNYARKNGLDPSIQLISRGSTSFVYSIGDKILKIGKPRKNHMVPYCEYLLQPIINRDILFDGIPMHIEVTQKVIAYRDLSDKWYPRFRSEMHKLKRKLHAIGINCSDLHKGNIGILTQDNTIHFDSIPFQTGDENATSIKNNNNLIVRKKGDFVIIDLDYIEIMSIHRYCKYLARIGYDTEKIEEIKKSHGIKVKIK